MNIFRRFFLSFFSWTLILSPILSLLPPQTPTASAQTAPERQERQTQFLIKQDGSLLEGVINVSGGYYTVEVAQGKGILYVRKEQVFKVVDSIAQAYQEKLQTMVYQDAREFLSLAEWCIQNKLYPQAQEALNQAQKQQNNHPMIKVYQRRLDIAQEQALREARQAQQQTQNQTRDTASAGLPGNSEENGRANVGNATAVNLEEEANRQILLQQRALEQMARNMPGDTLKQFTSEIQPLLQSGCGTASCHGAETQTDFKIIPSASKARSLTLRNLYSALRQVNRENPQNSPLLTKAVEAHGQLEVPIFSKSRASAYSRLVSWTYRVTRPARIYSVEQTHFLDQTIGRHSKEEKTINPFEQAFWEEAETPPEPTGAGKSEPTAMEPAVEPSIEPVPASSQSAVSPNEADQTAPESGGSRRKTGLQNGLPNKPKTSTVQRGNPKPESYEAMDPFDPNTFNNLQTGPANNTSGPANVPPDLGAGLAPGTTIQSAIQPGTSGSAVVQFTPDGYKAASSQTAAPVIPAWSNAAQPAAGEPSLVSGNGTRNNLGSNPGYNSEMPRQPSIASQSSVISAPGTFGGINNSPDQVMAQPNYGIQPGPAADQYMQTPAQQMLNQQSVPQDDEPVAIIRNGKLISGSSAWENSPQAEEPVNRKPTAKTNSSRTNRSNSTSPEDAGYDELPRVDLLFGGK